MESGKKKPPNQYYLYDIWCYEFVDTWSLIWNVFYDVP